jgi:alkaline phosphatase D
MHSRFLSILAVLALPLGVCAASAGAADEPLQAASRSGAFASVLGPMLGTPEPTGIVIWFRSGQAGEHLLTVTPRHGVPAYIDSQKAIADSDLTLRWSVTDLEPDTEYVYDIVLPDGRVYTSDDFAFRTPLDEDTPQRVSVALASRAPTDSTPAWTRMQAERVDAVVLLGDSPVIDTTDLAIARARQRALLGVPEFARLVRTTPTLATWDDRDFGGLRADGNLPDKYNTRRAFVEYHASKAFGRVGEGVYTSVRLGPVEIFLLDTRYFADIEPSITAPSEPTLLGHEQWDWLTQCLNASTATFKILASGRLWDMHPSGSRDDWEQYAQERDPLIYLCGQSRVQGVVLAAGDLGASRAMKFPLAETLGYDTWQLIPGSLDPERVETPATTHTALVHQASEAGVFIKLIADNTVSPATLEAIWINAQGDRLFSVRTDSSALSGEVPLDRP